MPWIVAKYLIIAALVVTISEVAQRPARRADRGVAAGDRVDPGLAASGAAAAGQDRQPCLVHLLVSAADAAKFLAFPLLLPRLGFWWTLAACALLTMACFGASALGVLRFGIQLL